MSHYSTGELANMFGLSKRTIQYYDHQQLLKPAYTDDNQYRMYTEREVEQLHLILVMKSLGLSLKEIKQMLSADGTLQTVRTLLTQKVAETEAEIRQQQQRLKQMKQMQQMILDSSRAPVKNLSDIEDAMKQKPQHQRLMKQMLWMGTTATLFEVIGIGLSWKYRQFWPAILGFGSAATLAQRMTSKYYQQVSYMCPNCQKQFKPSYRTWLLAPHTSQTRMLTCPNCGFKGYCTEIYDASMKL
ncbi:MerR family transcriptional regulator [Staphylococcus pseudintermedius]|uniref:MerR family transcriptional regulator n=1 Tax=Staphylococcus pseudintermedius TaxID=283734 RepID=UPI0019EB0506|nr:MerR family transcriptional regulator [Staphylococcus pseudintermedius]EGQ3420796.1 MerR family transcriptional regulator [Staphylococcus pseudintermedius]EGQ4285624.1 MerR family transcriptional regulator [Staphylococcus pseudintermedius]EHS7218919.1 MerR family transcriptional regulator [Staphylococcus pseudintermedius]EHV5289312.1 MerR family transcriptional regulator [Staphylococcus pseudintermedius]